MTDVILINPPVCYVNGYPSVLDVSYPPLGLLHLASCLEKEKISVKILDPGAQKQSLFDTLNIVKKETPCIIGISAMTPLLQGVITLAKNIKKNNRFKTKIALGGPHVSADPDFVNRHPYFDFAVTGESEITFIQLAKKVISGKTVTGVYPGQFVNHLDDLPFPARHLINLKNYLPTASLMTTRGCPFNCYYCSRPAISNHVRCRSPKNVIEEMDSLYDNCRGDYLFQDDTLTINKKNTLDLCETMLSKNRQYRWSGYTRIDLIDEELIRLMAKAGCQSLTFGIETGDDTLRRTIVKKNFKNHQIITVIKLCRKYGINPDGFFMLGHPTETPDQVKKTVNFILKNDFNIVGVSIATPFPGSKLWKHAVRDNIINYDFIDNFAEGQTSQGYAGVYPVYCPKSLNLNWLYQQRQYIMRHFYLHPKRILHRLLTDIIYPSNLKRDLVEGFNVILKGSSSRSPYQKQTSPNK